MKNNIIKRTEKLQSSITDKDCDAFVIINNESSNWESLYYMSGFRGTSGALVFYKDSVELILDSRYAAQGREQSPHTIFDQKSGLIEDISASLSKHSAKKVLCEAEKTAASMWRDLTSSGLELFDGTAEIKTLRRTKDEFEIKCITKAAEIATAAFLDLMNIVKVGMTEKEVESLLNYKINMLSGEIGFDMIVASGKRSSMPHGRATDKVIEKGEWVTVDFGARWNGYFCDITRNFSIDKVDDRAKEYHDILLKAHKAAAAQLKSGANGTDIHNTAYKVLENHSLGRYFTHALGHGFGLEIHEAPYLRKSVNDLLKPGDTVTIEPGIYIEGWGGLRIEDDYLVTETASKRLTNKLKQDFYLV